MACGQLDRPNKSDNSSILTKLEKSVPHNLKVKIDTLTKSLSKPYFNSIFIRLLDNNQSNAQILYQYIVVEYTELSIKKLNG